ncbi:hypothetical protein ALI22I_07625 [Saccharothrix sp. ALI-22-I]|uniref:hypothetical protein n=1 Tax=Saccharothrix sp. ALI-22-I TaxID=1933778 RepID=UPI00097C6B09|nr:hypothetical protein [Saccharothrix sp. ALI-22-I]ONI91728.1 hypothetical protein ALI22I_07625 [Saccharothrix sp. ALI-22-I]
MQRVGLAEAVHLRGGDFDDEHVGEVVDFCAGMWLVRPVTLCSFRSTTTWMSGALRSAIGS